MLARQDGTRPRLWNDYFRVGEACRAAEDRFDLRRTAPRDRTAAHRPTRAESEKARRHGFQEATRITLRRAVSPARSPGPGGAEAQSPGPAGPRPGARAWSRPRPGARAPYGRVPPVEAPDGIGLRRSTRQLSLAASAGDETVRAQMRLILQLSRLARAVTDLREAQRHAAQAAAARQAAEVLRAAWRASTSWSPQELASARTAAERVRLDFPFPPGPVRPGTGPPAGAHRSGPRP